MSKLKLTGKVRLRCFKADGSLKWDTGFIKNTITYASLSEVASLVGGIGGTAFAYLAVGTDSTAEDPNHTALQAEITSGGLSRASVTPSLITVNQTDDTLQWKHTWSATASFTVEEVGVFNDASAGTMLGRKLTGSKGVDSGETLEGVYEVTFS